MLTVDLASLIMARSMTFLNDISLKAISIYINDPLPGAGPGGVGAHDPPFVDKKK